MAKRSFAVLVALGLALGAAGCAGSMTNWLINLRNSQGDSAMENKNLIEARKEYELALALAPFDHHARAGLAAVLYLTARDDFINSKLDDAEIQVKEALQYAPGDPDTQALASEIEQARIRRDIVLANYPSYKSVGAGILTSLKLVITTDKDIQKQVAAFAYDYDPVHLTKAIAESIVMQGDVGRITQRITAYRALVQAGVPKAQSPIETETPNLLPIP